jgi:archaeal flagellin N-terminal-like domain
MDSTPPYRRDEMNGPQLNDVDRGQVGIGTLIVFIALVLVAAVAAGVLINTSGELESRASDTGEDAQSQVSNQIDVVSATGVNPDGDESAELVQLVVKKSAGSDPIDLQDMTVQYTSGAEVANLEHTASGGATVSAFNTTQVAASDASPDVLNSTDERVRLGLSAAKIESGVPEGEEVEVKLIDQSGATTVYGVNVPDVISSEYFPV